jgi:hypothetical protein
MRPDQERAPVASAALSALALCMTRSSSHARRTTLPPQGMNLDTSPPHRLAEGEPLYDTTTAVARACVG